MTINEVSELVAQSILSVISEPNWTKSNLYIQGDDSYIKLNGDYVDNCNQIHQLSVHKFDPGLSFALMELHEITTEGGDNKWNRAVFSLTSDGEFDMEFIWDQELHDEIEAL